MGSLSPLSIPSLASATAHGCHKASLQMMLQGSMPGAAAEWNRTEKKSNLSKGEVIFVTITAQVEVCACVCG